MTNRGDETEFSVTVNSKLCVGHGRCYELAPKVFDEDESGYCVVLQERISKALLSQAQNGEGNCPEGAIRIRPL